jgi:hypothetical protein
MKKHPETWTVGKIWASQGAINFSPDYQRPGGIWATEKQQNFIDSILNGYDIPKMYLNGLGGNDKFHYAVIDGKQRMQCLLDFMESRFPLGSSFQIDQALYQHIKSPAPKANEFYKEFSEEWKEALKSINLDVVIIDDIEGIEDLVEDLFSRLNNGVPLNVTEKRHALPGVMSKYVHEVSQAAFFTEFLPIPNTRFKHEEIAIKIIKMAIISDHGARPVCDFKSSSLDKIVKNGRNYTVTQLEPIKKRVTAFLSLGTKLFEKNDSLLKSHSLIPGYLAFAHEITAHYGHPNLTQQLKKFFPWFENERVMNNQNQNDEEMDSDLAAYTELVGQGTTSLRNMEDRVEILTKFFLRQYSDVQIKDKVREFNPGERYAIWFRAGKRCQNSSCGRELPTLDLMAADHVQAWINGGATALANAQCLCITCNSAKGARTL